MMSSFCYMYTLENTVALKITNISVELPLTDQNCAKFESTKINIPEQAREDPSAFHASPQEGTTTHTSSIGSARCDKQDVVPLKHAKAVFRT